MSTRESGADRAEVASCVRARVVLGVAADTQGATVVATDVDGAPGVVAGGAQPATVVMRRPTPYLQTLEGETRPGVLAAPRPHILQVVAAPSSTVVALATVTWPAGRAKPGRPPVPRIAAAAPVASAVHADLAATGEETLPVGPAFETAATGAQARILPTRPGVARLVAS